MAARGNRTRTRVEDIYDYERFKGAGRNGDIQAMYDLFGEDYLDNFYETPLHLAAEKGHTHYVMELMTHIPSMATVLNPCGLSPMHLALQNKHTGTVRGLIAIEGSLVSVKGIGRFTPLHHVAQTGDTDLLSEFLVACPESIEDITIRRETVVHVAVKNYQLEATKVLVGWLKREKREDILDWKDEDGNTALHIAAAINHIGIIKLLRGTVKVTAKNLNGQTAMDILQIHQPPCFPKASRLFHNVKERLLCGSTVPLAKYISKKASCIEKRNSLLGLTNMDRTRHGYVNSNDSRSVILVVAILIVTTTYQAGLSPPGGFRQEDSEFGHYAGQLIMPFSDAVYFYSLNGIAFFSSLYVILILIVGLPMWKILFGSTAALGIANLATFIRIFPSSEYYAIAIVFAYPVTLAAVVFGPAVAFLINKYSRKRVDFPCRYFSAPHEA